MKQKFTALKNSLQFENLHAKVRKKFALQEYQTGI